MRIFVPASMFLFFLVLIFSFKETASVLPASGKYELNIPEGFPVPQIPEDNQLTYVRVQLGRMLFYDKILSSNYTLSCASCHAPENSFSDLRQFSLGVEDSVGVRNSMPLVNLAWSNSFMWDGGVASLELQIMNPLTSHREMNMKIKDVVARLNAHSVYPKLFKKAYGCKPDENSIFRAIASFERTLVSSNSKYDKFYYGRDATVFNDSEIRGYFLFNGNKTHCTSCHTGFNFTNNTFQNNGLYSEYADQGRYNITHDDSDKGKFKVPGLRNVALTAPYMHDGSIKTLEEVIEHYNSGGKDHPNKSMHVHNNDSPPLTEEEKTDLINFLKTLTDEEFINNPNFKQPL